MVTISLCMIVKNEERVLGRCLESVQEIADEIIIVDTGSEDQGQKRLQKNTMPEYLNRNGRMIFKSEELFIFSGRDGLLHVA